MWITFLGNKNSCLATTHAIMQNMVCMGYLRLKRQIVDNFCVFCECGKTMTHAIMQNMVCMGCRHEKATHAMTHANAKRPTNNPCKIYTPKGVYIYCMFAWGCVLIGENY